MNDWGLLYLFSTLKSIAASKNSALKCTLPRLVRRVCCVARPVGERGNGQRLAFAFESAKARCADN